jgi:diguanylate cyclase (GGDEF)-like protein
MYFEQFEELKHTGRLPSPSGVGLRVLMLTRSEDCSLNDIAATLQTDPALTGRVLKLANSVLTAGTQPANTVHGAAVRLGLRTICNVALGFSLITDNRTGRCRGFDYDHYWSWSLANAVAAQRLSRELRLGTPGEAFTLALLARVGRLALASVHPEEYARIIERKLESATELARAEHDVFFIHHREVAAAIAEDWGLPLLFSEVGLYSGVRIPEVLECPESRDYLRLLASSSAIADVLVAANDLASLHWPRARESTCALGLPPESIEPFYDTIGEEWKHWGELLRVPAEFQRRAVEIEASAGSRSVVRIAGASSLRILAVDDDVTSLKIVAAMLEREGHSVVQARNGREALALALESPPQMVVTDWMMPEMDGVELCKRLRSTEAGRELYILILTGRSEEERVVEAFEAGADDYLLKPIGAKMLLARIRPGARVIQLQEDLRREVREKDDANARLKMEKRKYRVASMTDALTDLPNRRGAMKRLEKEWATSERSELPLSLIMVDIDHFKQVNDTYGHDIGDEVLRRTARALERVLRSSDTCARLGGEEFVILCPATPLDGAKLLAERIRLSVEENRVSVPGYEGRVTISLGVSSRAAGLDSIDALLKAADEAVYEAKRKGRNRVEVGGPREQRRSA